MKTCENCQHRMRYTGEDGSVLHLCIIEPEEFDDRLYLLDCSSVPNDEETMCCMWREKS